MALCSQWILLFNLALALVCLSKLCDCLSSLVIVDRSPNEILSSAVSFPKGGVSVRLIGNQTLRQQLLKYKSIYTSLESPSSPSVQSLSPVRLFATPWTAAHQASLSITNSQNLPKLMSIESVVQSNHLILCRPLLRLCSIFPSIRVFSNESALCIRLAKVLEFQLQHQSFQWTPRSDLLKDGLVRSPCSPRDSQESSSAPPIKSISSSALSFLCSPTLTSIHDYWKSHSID